MSAVIPTGQVRKGLAIASLVIGVISLLTLSLLLVGALTGIVLGVIALNRIKSNPAQYGGRGMAIAGIVTSALSILLAVVVGILAAIAVPKLQDNLGKGRETAAIAGLQAIHKAEVQYNAMKGRFATLKELADAELIAPAYANEQSVSQFLYTDSGVSTDTYCVHATRLNNSSAQRDFVICEDGLIRFVESTTINTVKRGAGTPLAR